MLKDLGIIIIVVFLYFIIGSFAFFYDLWNLIKNFLKVNERGENGRN